MSLAFENVPSEVSDQTTQADLNLRLAKTLEGTLCNIMPQIFFI